MEQGFDFANIPLVGREAIREKLLLGLQSASEGRGQTVLLRGGPGSGKTHLSEFFLPESV